MSTESRRQGTRGAGRARKAAESGGERESSAARRVTARPASRRGWAAILVAEFGGLTQVATVPGGSRGGALLRSFLGAMTDAAVLHGANIQCFAGEEVLLVFEGNASSRRRAAVRAVRTAVALQRSFLELRNRWLAAGYEPRDGFGLRIGVGSGDVMYAGLESGAGAPETVVGQAVKRAALLCRAAQRAELLLDPETYERIADASEGNLVFTAAEVAGPRRSTITAYRCHLRRAGLRLVEAPVRRNPACGQAI